MWEDPESHENSLNDVFPYEEILWGCTDLDSNQSHLL